jgi:putative ABC transport system permease protein
MIKFNTFIKYLEKNKLYTFIEIFGLSVSLMFVILTGVYTSQELSVDSFQEKKDRLYLMASEDSYGFAYKLAGKLKDKYPEIEEVCPYFAVFKKTAVTLGEEKASADLLFVDPSFFSMMSFPVINGDAGTALVARDYAVISESFARMAFPGRNPLGQSIRVSDDVVLTVNAVMKDIRNSAVPYGDILLRNDRLIHFNEVLLSDSYANFGSVPIIVLAAKNADLQAKTEDVLAYLKENVWTYKREMNTQVSFVPLKDVYFSKIKGYNGLMTEQGDKTFVLILLSVGALILLFAIINYINLTVAQTGFRAKEMAMRRLLGSSREELFYRLIAESTLLTLVSFCVGLLLSWITVPYANQLLETQIDLRMMITPGNLLISLAVILLTGGLSGLLPALVISNAKPVEVVKGTFRRKTKMVYSRFFITFQHAITIALVTAALVMVFQFNHLVKAPLGYNTVNIVNINITGLGDRQTALTLANEFRQLASVKRTAFCQSLPFERGSNYTMEYNGRTIEYQGFIGDSAFVEMLGFRIIRENNLSGEGFYLSRQAFRELEISEDAPYFPFHHFGGTQQAIAGVIEDFRLENILFELRPVLLRIKNVEDFDPWNIAVEVTGNPYEAFRRIKDVYERITQLEFAGTFVDRQIAASFAPQKRAATIVGIFSGIAILLSFLGLVAMSTCFIQQRSREIAVRKVFGSSNPEILKKLVFAFLNYVVIAFVLVTPVVWYIMREWLSGYFWRIRLSPWFFICAGLFGLFISFLTVFRQSYRAANENPAVKLKAE